MTSLPFTVTTFSILLVLTFAGEVWAKPSTSEAVQTSENACLDCHGNKAAPSNWKSNEIRPPVLSTQYSMDWIMYEFKSQQNPPFERIPRPHTVKRGRTFYDWSNFRMIEIYEDRCINIFPKGNNFSCKFVSHRDKTYFITYKFGALNAPETCCLWSDSEFWAPRPDVLQHMRYQKEFKRNGKSIQWWVYDIPLPGPFGYGTLKDSTTPVAFWFPVIDGWVQQEFSNYSSKKPDPKIFELPSLCNQPLKVCQ